MNKCKLDLPNTSKFIDFITQFSPPKKFKGISHLFTVKELAEFLGVTPRRIRQMTNPLTCKRNHLKKIKSAYRPFTNIKIDDLIFFLEIRNEWSDKYELHIKLLKEFKYWHNKTYK